MKFASIYYLSYFIFLGRHWGLRIASIYSCNSHQTHPILKPPLQNYISENFIGIHCREKVLIPRTKPFITLQGSGNTTIQWGDTANMLGADGSPIGTYKTATVGVDASYFIARNITFKVNPYVLLVLCFILLELINKLVKNEVCVPK